MTCVQNVGVCEVLKRQICSVHKQKSVWVGQLVNICLPLHELLLMFTLIIFLVWGHLVWYISIFIVSELFPAPKPALAITQQFLLLYLHYFILNFWVQGSVPEGKFWQLLQLQLGPHCTPFLTHPHSLVVQPLVHLHPLMNRPTRFLTLWMFSEESQSHCILPSSTIHPNWVMLGGDSALHVAWLHTEDTQHVRCQWRHRASTDGGSSSSNSILSMNCIYSDAKLQVLVDTEVHPGMQQVALFFALFIFNPSGNVCSHVLSLLAIL